jgi:hypothetical protein
MSPGSSCTVQTQPTFEIMDGIIESDAEYCTGKLVLVDGKLICDTCGQTYE